MSSEVLYGITFVLLAMSFIKDRGKTKKALKKAYKSLLKNLSMLVSIMVIMGIVLSIIDSNYISMIFGKESGIYGILLGLGLGSVSFMPSFIAFPLGASLLENGAGYPQVAGFISSLMAVGFISLSMEAKYFGMKTAVTRNSLALVASISFVFVVWRFM